MRRRCGCASGCWDPSIPIRSPAATNLGAGYHALWRNAEAVRLNEETVAVMERVAGARASQHAHQPQQPGEWIRCAGTTGAFGVPERTSRSEDWLKLKSSL